MKSVKISEKHYNDISMLKIAYKVSSRDAVLEILIAPHRIDKIKALGIEIQEK